MKVRAKGNSTDVVGYYGHLRRRGGDVFVLQPIKTIRKGKPVVIPVEKQFSERWMEKVPDVVPETRPQPFNSVGAGRPRPENPNDNKVPAITDPPAGGSNQTVI